MMISSRKQRSPFDVLPYSGTICLAYTPGSIYLTLRDVSLVDHLEECNIHYGETDLETMVELSGNGQTWA